jgi:predicted metal-dependent hydrolase
LTWLNLELAKKPLVCLNYVILHELAHLVSPRDDEAFVAILDRELPGGRQVRSDLNALPLAFETSFAGQRQA